jgi:hypothetical protein
MSSRFNSDDDFIGDELVHHPEMTVNVSKAIGNLTEVIDFDRIDEDCWELTYVDSAGNDQSMDLDDNELEVLAGCEPLVMSAWESYLEAGSQVAAESYAERRQMGFSDF